MIACATGAGIITAPAAVADLSESDPVFTIDSISSGSLSQVNFIAGITSKQSNPEAEVSAYRDPKTGEVAVVDLSLGKSTAIAAVGRDFVDLSWRKIQGVTEYLVLRDDAVLARTSAATYRDLNVNPGTTYSYRITISGQQGDADPRAGNFGFLVRVPLYRETEAKVALPDVLPAAAQSAGTLVSRAFIKPARVQGPLIPGMCSYGSSYDFGGDNRDYMLHTGSSTSRISLTTIFNFDGRGVTNTIKSIGQTKVYRRSDGALVDTQTASSNGVYAKNASTPSGGKVDINVRMEASNPFCNVGQISGSFILRVTNTGSWQFVQGSHRQMPHWEVYLVGTGSNGVWRTLYKKNAMNEACLVGTACPTAPFYGSGSY